MLRLVQIGNSLPISYPADSSSQFQPGMIGQLGVIGNNIVCSVSDGTAPFGIIDDIRTSVFTAPAINEIVIASAVGVDVGGVLVAATDVQALLKNPNVVPSSFTASVDCELVPRNGAVIFVAGTPLNFDIDGDGIPDSIRTVVSYTWQIPNVPGDDSVIASGKVTLFFTRGLYQTDQYETNQQYPVNANLFVSESGLLTTRQASEAHPGVALCTGPPGSVVGTLEFLWL
jgi:hypothetical protein